MKTVLLSVLLVNIFGFYSCHDSLEPTGCIDDKIAAFKQETYAEYIIKIDRPGGALYWFIDSTADGGEEVLNERCDLVCITDCECTGTFVQCDATHFDYPKFLIWHK